MMDAADVVAALRARLGTGRSAVAMNGSDWDAVCARLDELEGRVAELETARGGLTMDRTLDERDFELLITCGIVIAIEVIERAERDWCKAAAHDLDQGDIGSAQELMASAYAGRTLRRQVAQSAATALTRVPAVLKALADRGEAGAAELLAKLTEPDNAEETEGV